MNLPNYKEAKIRNKENNIERIKYQKNSKIFKNKTYHIKTYGCQMNEHDTENIKAMLEEIGFTYNEDMQEVDLVILNTCSIRENAHNKAFGMLGRLKHLKEVRPNLIVGLCGCMAQEEGVINEIMTKYKWINFVFGTHNLHELPKILKNSLNNNNNNLDITVYSTSNQIVEDMPVIRSSKYKAYVNIIYGCDKFCTYCIVPYTRGFQKSRLLEDIVKEVKDLVKEGYKEVTLLGQNVNAYGKDLPYGYDLSNLLEEVSKTNIPRIRFVTSHPWDFTDNMIEVIKRCENIMPSIHLPVQSGSNNILKLMGRRYTKEEYIALFDKLKKARKDMTVSTDIIVGFPKEKEEDFNETLKLVDYCKFDNAFTFIYSKRENTPASKIEDKTTTKEKEKRLAILNEKVNKYFKENNEKLVGKTLPVLVEEESQKTDYLVGYTSNNKLVNFKGDKSLIGSIVDVEITAAKTWSLDGKLN